MHTQKTKNESYLKELIMGKQWLLKLHHTVLIDYHVNIKSMFIKNF